MKIYLDLHIHTALSPCGHEDMTPNNIINMSILKGLDVIAITDHNSCKNVIPVVELGKKNNIIVIPGMEVQTREEIHIICLFTSVEKAINFQELVYEKLPNVINNKKILGQQLIIDIYDKVIDEEERMLLISVNMSIEEIFEKVEALGGVCIPAHVDKNSYSIIHSLGFIPESLNVRNLECVDENKIKAMMNKGLAKKDMRIIKSSDAHFLWDINEKIFILDVEEKSLECIIDLLRK